MKIAYLSPSFYLYRVPVFERMYKIFGNDFVVFANSYQTTKRGKEALMKGNFPRIILKGRHYTISKRHDQGKETPFGFTLTPSLAIELIKFKPDIVISINLNSWTLTSILLGFHTIIFWEGTHFTERTVQKWRLLLRKWMVKKAKGFIVNGKLSKQYLINLGAPNNLIFEGGLCPLDPPEYFIKERNKRSNSKEFKKITFLYVGQLIRRKGVYNLLKSFALVAERYKNKNEFELVLVGDGPEKSNLQLFSKDLKIKELIHFVGDVSYDEIWNWYDKADVFVLPTLQDNWPLVVPEAMKMGLPILLSIYAGSSVDLVENNKNGYCFDPKNLEELAELMLNYIKNPKMILEQGEYSKKMVNPYNPKNVVDIYIECIKKSLEN